MAKLVVLCTSNHKLHIETGRYTRPITPVENRICSNCNSKSVEDEIHFLMYCPKFENHRTIKYVYILSKMVHCYRTLKDSLHMPPAARGHDECFAQPDPVFDHGYNSVNI
jgi:hypothetical protein